MSHTRIETPAVAVLSHGHALRLLDGAGCATAITWPGTGSRHRAMHRIVIGAGAATMVLRHPGEAVYVVAEGRGRVGDLPLSPLDVIFIPERTAYRISADQLMTVYGGPCPPDPALYREGGPAPTDGDDRSVVRILRAEHDGVALPMISRDAWLVVWPGSGARTATMNVVRLAAGEANQPHVHEESDDTIVILAGEGSIDDLDSGQTYDYAVGDVLFVRGGVRHRVKADRGVATLSAGGPCPPDFAMLRALGLA